MKEVTDLLLIGAPVAQIAGLFEKPPEIELILVSQLAVYVPARLVSRNRVVLHPAAAGIGVEVLARINRPIHRSGVEARRVRQRRQRLLRLQQNRQKRDGK